MNNHNRISSNKYGYKGVCFRKDTKKFYGVLNFNNKRYKTKNIYDTPEEAALAYNQLAIKYYGDYACLNIL